MSFPPVRFSLPLLNARFLLLMLLLLLASVGRANELTLAVDLGLTPKQAQQSYKPLISYLQKATGQRIRLQSSANALAHWEKMRREHFDLVLDNPAFTAYRAERMGYTVIGKLPDVLSFTLVAQVDEMMFEPGELIGRTVASQPSPSMTALRLAELYTNPMQQPEYVQADTHMQALELVEQGRAVGAMVPTGLVAGFPNVTPLYTTDQLPAPALSVSDRVSPELREKIRNAMLDAHNSREGRAMLDALNVPQFEPANNDVYAGLETLLDGLFGY
ncbi:MAG TPA: PhnD/SsuA/transferrin family substrate-binding protein [Gammaproteobacteria bacterium]